MQFEGIRLVMLDHGEISVFIAVCGQELFLIYICDVLYIMVYLRNLK